MVAALSLLLFSLVRELVRGGEPLLWFCVTQSMTCRCGLILHFEKCVLNLARAPMNGRGLRGSMLPPFSLRVRGVVRGGFLLLEIVFQGGGIFSLGTKVRWTRTHLTVMPSRCTSSKASKPTPQILSSPGSFAAFSAVVSVVVLVVDARIYFRVV